MERNPSKKKSIRELSQELSKPKVIVKPKVSRIKLFILSLFGIKLKPIKFLVGDLLRRKTSDNPREIYEVKQNLLDYNLNPVIIVLDVQNKQNVVISEDIFSSFKVSNEVVPGTMVNPNDM